MTGDLHEIIDRYLVERRTGWRTAYDAPDEARRAARVLTGVRLGVALAVRQLIGGSIVLITDGTGEPWPVLGIGEIGGGSYVITHPLGRVHVSPDEREHLTITDTDAVAPTVIRAMYRAIRYGLMWPLYETAVGRIPLSSEEANLQPVGVRLSLGTLAERVASRALDEAARQWKAGRRVWVDVPAIVEEVA